LAEEGCDVVLVSRTATDLAAAACDKSRGSTTFRCAYLALDLSDGRMSTSSPRMRRHDLLVNNAGAIPGGSIAEIDEARWRQAWDLKVFGYINMTRRFYALMAARKKGVIVNVLGAAARTPISTMSPALRAMPR